MAEIDKDETEAGAARRGAVAGSAAAELADQGIPVVHVAEDQATAGDLSLNRVAEICHKNGTPIRMRLSIQLWDGEQYTSWRGQTWKVEARDADEARAIQQTLELYFDLLARKGVESLSGMLEEEKELLLGTIPTK